MPNTQLPSDALETLMKQSERVVAEESYALYADFKLASPVDTGMFKQSWVLSKKSGQSGLAWTIFNPLEYASILYDGRRKVGGRKYGSDQWPNGGEPMVQNTDITITQRIKRLKA